jgi:hypothetical protein
MVNRDDLIAYLLHTMPEEERAAVAERWMTDPGLHQQLRACEAELLDAYARNGVSPGERALIERHLLGSATQRQKLAFAEALHTALPATNRRKPSWLVAAAAAAMILLVAGAAWLVWQNQELRREMATVRAHTPSLTSGSVYATLLPLNGVRGPAADERRVVIPSGAEIVRLDLELEPGDETSTYSATTSQGAAVVWSEEPVRPLRRGAAFVAPVWIPAAVLAPGRYEVALKTGATTIAYYRFIIADPQPRPAR